jgi:hypothetical protein
MVMVIALNTSEFISIGLLIGIQIYNRPDSIWRFATDATDPAEQ